MLDEVFDYHTIVDIDTPREERRRLNTGDLYINAARCNACNDEVRSRNIHDFRWCKCGNISVDGGSWYAKRSFKPDGPGFEDIIVRFSDANEEAKEMDGLLSL